MLRLKNMWRKASQATWKVLWLMDTSIQENYVICIHGYGAEGATDPYRRHLANSVRKSRTPKFEKPSLEQKGYEVLQRLQKHTWFGDPYSTLLPLFDMQFHQNHQSAPFLMKSTNHDGGWTFNIGRPLRGAGTMFYKVWRESNPFISVPTQPFWGILYRLYTSIHSIFGPLP